jgi:F420-dependent oxidoreductase-like protein
MALVFSQRSWRKKIMAHHPIRFGIQTPPQLTGWNRLTRIWQLAEQSGFHTAWVFDHFFPIFTDPSGPCLEAWTTLSALAARTQRMQVGVLVTGNTYRHPALLANMAVSVDHVSDGRLVFGLGAGWFELEHRAYGIPFPPVGERIRRLDESLSLIKLLWTEERATFKGQYYEIRDAYCEPKPLQRPHPPIMVGGGGERMTLRVVARHADQWNTMGPPETFKKKIALLEGYCREIGRDSSAIEKSVLIQLRFTAGEGETERYLGTYAEQRRFSLDEARGRFLVGSPEEIRRQIQVYAETGVTHFILSLMEPYDEEGLRRFSGEVMPAFRS